MNQRGFTLLEVLVATMIMAIAVVGLLSGISASLRNAAHLTDYDRAVLLARAKMDELLLEPRVPRFSPIAGPIDPVLLGGAEGGWRAQVTPFDLPPGTGLGPQILDRVELEIWWMSGAERRSFMLEAYKPGVFQPQDTPRRGQ